jgi:hypothetical protein
MSSLFSKPPKPDTSKLEAQEAEQDRLDRQQKTIEATREQRLKKKPSLLTGAETGLRETLG